MRIWNGLCIAGLSFLTLIASFCLCQVYTHCSNLSPYQKACQRLNEHEYHIAEQILLKLLADPDLQEKCEIQKSLADCYAATGKFKQAENLYKQVLFQKFTTTTVQRLAQVYQKQNKTKEAELLYQSAVSKLQYSNDLKIDLGQLFIATKRYQEAKPILLKVLNDQKNRKSERSYLQEFQCLSALAEIEKKLGNEAESIHFEAEAKIAKEHDERWGGIN